MYTLLLSIIAVCSFVHGTPIESKSTYIYPIDAGNGLERGKWGSSDYCPSGSYARQFEVKFEETGHMDDTYVNAVRFYCYYDDTNQLAGYAISSEGDEGDWQGMRTCPNSGKITGYEMAVQDPAGNFHDDLGVTDIRVLCEDGTILHGLDTSDELTSAEVAKSNSIFSSEEDSNEDDDSSSSEERSDTSMGPLATCPDTTYVCGLQTRVERHTTATDDAGLCDLRLFCCNEK